MVTGPAAGVGTSHATFWSSIGTVGLVFVLGGIPLMVSQHFRAVDAYLHHKDAARQLEQATKAYGHDVARLFDFIESLAIQGKPIASPGDPPLAERAGVDLEGHMSSLERLNAVLAEQNDRIRNSQTLFVAGLVITVVGLPMMLFGYTMWYFKIQRHRDRLLEIEIARVNVGLKPPDLQQSSVQEQIRMHRHTTEPE